MEFDAIILGESYRFSSVSQNTFLVSGPRAEYIVYNRNNHWHCADEIQKRLLDEVKIVLNEHTQLAH